MITYISGCYSIPSYVLKWRSPSEYHGDTFFIDLLIESSSRTDPPGILIAVTVF